LDAGCDHSMAKVEVTPDTVSITHNSASAAHERLSTVEFGLEGTVKSNGYVPVVLDSGSPVCVSSCALDAGCDHSMAKVEVTPDTISITHDSASASHERLSTVEFDLEGAVKSDGYVPVVLDSGSPVCVLSCALDAGCDHSMAKVEVTPDTVSITHDSASAAHERLSTVEFGLEGEVKSDGYVPVVLDSCSPVYVHERLSETQSFVMDDVNAPSTGVAILTAKTPADGQETSTPPPSSNNVPADSGSTDVPTHPPAQNSDESPGPGGTGTPGDGDDGDDDSSESDSDESNASSTTTTDTEGETSDKEDHAESPVHVNSHHVQSLDTHTSSTTARVDVLSVVAFDEGEVASEDVARVPPSDFTDNTYFDAPTIEDIDEGEASGDDLQHGDAVNRPNGHVTSSCGALLIDDVDEGEVSDEDASRVQVPVSQCVHCNCSSTVLTPCALHEESHSDDEEDIDDKEDSGDEKKARQRRKVVVRQHYDNGPCSQNTEQVEGDKMIRDWNTLTASVYRHRLRVSYATPAPTRDWGIQKYPGTLPESCREKSAIHVYGAVVSTPSYTYLGEFQLTAEEIHSMQEHETNLGLKNGMFMVHASEAHWQREYSGTTLLTVFCDTIYASLKECYETQCSKFCVGTKGLNDLKPYINQGKGLSGFQVDYECMRYMYENGTPLVRRLIDNWNERGRFSHINFCREIDTVMQMMASERASRSLIDQCAGEVHMAHEAANVASVLERTEIAAAREWQQGESLSAVYLTRDEWPQPESDRESVAMAHEAANEDNMLQSKKSDSAQTPVARVWQQGETLQAIEQTHDEWTQAGSKAQKFVRENIPQPCSFEHSPCTAQGNLLRTIPEADSDNSAMRAGAQYIEAGRSRYDSQNSNAEHKSKERIEYSAVSSQQTCKQHEQGVTRMMLIELGCHAVGSNVRQRVPIPMIGKVAHKQAQNEYGNNHGLSTRTSAVFRELLTYAQARHNDTCILNRIGKSGTKSELNAARHSRSSAAHLRALGSQFSESVLEDKNWRNRHQQKKDAAILHTCSGMKTNFLQDNVAGDEVSFLNFQDPNHATTVPTHIAAITPGPGVICNPDLVYVLVDALGQLMDNEEKLLAEELAAERMTAEQAAATSTRAQHTLGTTMSDVRLSSLDVILSEDEIRQQAYHDTAILRQQQRKTEASLRSEITHAQTLEITRHLISPTRSHMFQSSVAQLARLAEICREAGMLGAAPWELIEWLCTVMNGSLQNTDGKNENYHMIEYLLGTSGRQLSLLIHKKVLYMETKHRETLPDPVVIWTHIDCMRQDFVQNYFKHAKVPTQHPGTTMVCLCGRAGHTPVNCWFSHEWGQNAAGYLDRAGHGGPENRGSYPGGTFGGRSGHERGDSAFSPVICANANTLGHGQQHQQDSPLSACHFQNDYSQNSRPHAQTSGILPTRRHTVIVNSTPAINQTCTDHDHHVRYLRVQLVPWHVSARSRCDLRPSLARGGSIGGAKGCKQEDRNNERESETEIERSGNEEWSNESPPSERQAKRRKQGLKEEARVLWEGCERGDNCITINPDMEEGNCLYFALVYHVSELRKKVQHGSDPTTRNMLADMKTKTLDCLNELQGKALHSVDFPTANISLQHFEGENHHAHVVKGLYTLPTMDVCYTEYSQEVEIKAEMLEADRPYAGTGTP
jgi:hypothetical protein